MPTFIAPFERMELFYMHGNKWTGPPVSCCGTRHPRRHECLPRLPTAATRSAPSSRHRRQSPRSPTRTQKLSSFAPTILGGRLPGKIGNANINPQPNGWGFLLLLGRSDACNSPPDCCERYPIKRLFYHYYGIIY